MIKGHTNLLLWSFGFSAMKSNCFLFCSCQGLLAHNLILKLVWWTAECRHHCFSIFSFESYISIKMKGGNNWNLGKKHSFGSLCFPCPECRYCHFREVVVMDLKWEVKRAEREFLSESCKESIWSQITNSRLKILYCILLFDFWISSGSDLLISFLKVKRNQRKPRNCQPPPSSSLHSLRVTIWRKIHHKVLLRFIRVFSRTNCVVKLSVSCLFR